MLNKNSLFLQLKKNADKLFNNFTEQSSIAQEKWQSISVDSKFKAKVENSNASFLVPSWAGNLSDKFKIPIQKNDYSILSVDGSQIYPDRNISNSGCFLINIGSCQIKYSKILNVSSRLNVSSDENSSVKINSEPTLFIIQDFLDQNNKINFSNDIVDLKREELELLNLLKLTLEENIDIAFVDGTVIFWFLESKPEEIKDLFLNSYLNILQKFYENKKIIAGFISFPKSKELVNLIKLGLCRFDFAECISCHRVYSDFPCKAVDNLIDTRIAKTYLNINERSNIFFSNSKITKSYPEHLKPCFFYLNADVEVVRIETFAYIAQDKDMLDFLSAVALDQIKKGLGYPVTLAYAHEAAVVKGPDREFFYSLLQREAFEQNKRLFFSQKSIKKRGIGV